MSERLLKMRLAIQSRAAEADAEWLRGICQDLLDLAITLDRRDPMTNYRAVIVSDGSWREVASGSKDYCIGYLDAFRGRDGPLNDEYKAVVVGTFVVWPEERWGESIEVAG